MTSHFDRAKLPPARTFYEREGFKLGRTNSKGWAMAQGQPPCHKSESGKWLSVNLDSGGFFCHGCKTSGGDVVAYVQLRDQADFKSAAQSLGAWDEAPSPETVRKLAAQTRERERAEAATAAQNEQEHRERIAARDQLHAVETLYHEAIAEHNWYLMSELLPRVRQAEELYWQSAGLEVRHER